MPHRKLNPPRIKRLPTAMLLFSPVLIVVVAAAIWTPSDNTAPEGFVDTLPQASAAEEQAAIASAEVAPDWETVTIKRGDTLGQLLSTRGATPADIHAIANSGEAGRALTTLRPGAKLKVGIDAEGKLQIVQFEPDVYRLVAMQRQPDDSFQGSIVERETMTVQRYAQGIVRDSLFASGTQAGLSDRVILEMADVFGYEIDFALEVHEGDSFRLLYEEILVDGNKVRDGNVLSAEYVNRGKTHQAVRYVDAEGKVSWYAPDGTSMRKAFLRSPVDFARISSRFNLRRKHPVLHTIRAHRGVDYAAARGTPVRATGDGRIEYAGNKGGYGRVVIIRHGSRYSTLYAHLNGYAGKTRTGARVSQGQIIGYVGSSGMSTGPHLHYEFRIGGAHVNPLTASIPRAESISAQDMPTFLAEANRLVALLDSYASQGVLVQAGSTPASVRGGM